MVAGKKVPTGHVCDVRCCVVALAFADVFTTIHSRIRALSDLTSQLAFACLLGIYATVKVAGMAFGGSKSSDAHAHSAAGGSLFPAPKRDFSAEKQEFVDKFVAAELAKQKH